MLKHQKIIALIFSFLLSFGLWARVLVITDLDDTIKVTGVKTSSMITNYLTGVEPFDKLISIYHELIADYQEQGEEVDMVYLTSAPRLVNSAMWLRDNGAPQGKLIERKNREMLTLSGKEHKLNQLKSLIQKSGHLYSAILMFGDNGENDPLVYTQTVKQFRLESKAQIFIRDVMAQATELYPGMPLEGLQGVNYFLSEYDLLSLPTFAFISAPLKQSIIDEREKGIFPAFMIERIEDKMKEGL